MRTIARVMAQKGSKVTRLHQTLLGDGTGRLSLVAEFESFKNVVGILLLAQLDPGREALPHLRTENHTSA